MDYTKKNIASYLLAAFWILAVPLIAYLSASEVKYTILLIGGVVGLSMAAISILHYRTGYYIAIALSLTLRLVERMSGTEMSIGVVIDGMLLITLLGSLMDPDDKSIKKINFMDPLLVTFYIYMGLILLEFFNPAIHDRHGWTTFSRGLLRNYLFMFLAMKLIRNMEDLKFFFKFWIVILTLAAVYACIQQWFGLLPFEKAFIARYPEKFKTVIILTGIRIFSFMSDPAVFGLLMACGVIINITLLIASRELVSMRNKVLLVVSMFLQFMALGYSGTRTAYIMVPMGVLLLVLINLKNRNTIIGLGLFVIAFLVLMFGPFHNSPTIVRMRTAFSGSEDASMNVREVNRHRIQPYIYSHPIGGGLLSCEPGSGTELDGFPPDSGYLRTALEQGWIGFIMVMINLYLLLKYAVNNYFRGSHPAEKQFALTTACVLFALTVSMYAQEASGLIESAMLYYGLNGIVIKTKYLSTTKILK